MVENYIWFFSNRLKFRKNILFFKKKSNFIGYKVVSENLLFIYKVRNKITHGSLRIHQENGWWFCGKGLETLQYLYQFLDGDGESGPGAYAFRTYSFADSLHREIKGTTLKQVEDRMKFIHNPPINYEDYIISNDEDMNKFKFNNLYITKEEQSCILNNRLRK